MGARRAATAAASLLAALLLLPAAAAGAPACGEPPETTGNTIVGTPCADTIRLPRSVTIALGEGGDDVLFGQRGNDRLFGGEGNDRLYGGVGDDNLRGGPGGDRLSGGFGADSLDGEQGDDVARGDATIDAIGDGGGGTDTLSFATGATPGFPNSGSFFVEAGFPAGAEGRGVYVDLGDGFANNGLAPSGGGVDEPLAPATDFGDFETVVGTPFPDYIVGTGGEESFHGGGGADLIDGNGGGDVAHGGADGDGCVDVALGESCESDSEEIDLRGPGAISVGMMATGAASGPGIYLAGSGGDDRASASFAADGASADPDDGFVTIALGAGSEGGFDTGPGAAGGCAPPSDGTVVCAVQEPPDSVLLAGMAGDDSLTAAGFPETVSVVLLGNTEADLLTGGETEDALVDGAGGDTVSAGGRDDALPNNGGADLLDAGAGEDLFVSNAVCDGDSLDGGIDRDNANWANFGSGVSIDMAAATAGLIGPDGRPRCSGGQPTTLRGIEDVEGTNLGDNLLGDPGPNQLLGRAGPDNYLAAGGNDHLLANSGDSDAVIACGTGFDTALIDFSPAHADDPAGDCESVEERAPNSFRPPDTPPYPDPEPGPGPSPPPPVPAPAPQPPPSGGAATVEPPPARDRTAPATLLRHRPAALMLTAARRRRVAFSFAASEAPVAFRCRLDRRPLRPCRSPRAYLVAPGRHTFRVYAVDAAGNPDPSPALFRFTLRRRTLD